MGVCQRNSTMVLSEHSTTVRPRGRTIESSNLDVQQKTDTVSLGLFCSSYWFAAGMSPAAFTLSDL